MPATTKKAEILVYTWLAREHRMQFGGVPSLSRETARHKLGAIMSGQLVDNWDKYLGSRRLRASLAAETESVIPYLRATQHIFKTTAMARAAVVWNGIAIGDHEERHGRELFDAANTASFGQLRAYYNDLEDSRKNTALPQAERLGQPLSDAIEPYPLTPIEGPGGEKQYDALRVYTAIAGLAVTHLMEQQELIGSMITPRPRLPTGQLEPWAR